MRRTYSLIVAVLCLGLTLASSATVQAAATDSMAPDYQPPMDTAGLQVVELLPHSPNCSPLDTSLLCGDYVKLFNGADMPVNLADYRLRTSYGGLNSSSRNTYTLDGILDPGQFMLVNARDDGSPLSLTDSGGYVWLEDAYGEMTYDPVIEYPDASSDSEIGQGWAHDGADWQWTESPQPDGPNDFPLLATTDLVVPEISDAPKYKPCRPDQFRNPATNRCKLIKSATKSLKPCRPDQYRNPATNRCKSIRSSTTSYKPCAPGKVRNPETHRCRSISGSTKSLKPCRPDQERNPETNRCRKIQPKITPVHDIKTASQASGQHWYLIAAIAAGAGAYVFYEWRQEMSDGLERFKTRLKPLAGQKSRNMLK